MGQVNIKSQLTLPDFMRQYSMSRTTIYRLINRAKNPMPAYKIGALWYVDIKEFEAWREAESKRNGGAA